MAVCTNCGSAASAMQCPNCGGAMRDESLPSGQPQSPGTRSRNAPLVTRFVEEIGTRAWLRCYWDGVPCHDGTSFHSVMTLLGDSPVFDDWDHWGKESDYPTERWPKTCERCGTEVPASAIRQIFTRSVYATGTPDGLPVPGDVYFERRDETRHPCYSKWTNCDGLHLMAMTPNGYHWDLDGRASNCGKPDDTTHRCWVRHGDPRAGKIHVDKNGNTCDAGQASIRVPGYHGHLHNGVFTAPFSKT